MKDSDQLKLLKDIKKRVMINTLKDMMKGKKGLGVIGFIILYSSMFYFFFSEFWSGITISSEDVVSFYVMGVLLSIFISLLLAIFSFSLQEFEIEYLLPLPIKKKNIFMDKFLRIYKVTLMIPLALTLLFHYMIRDSSGASILLTLRLSVGLFLTTSAVYLFGTYLSAVYNQIFDQKKKRIVQGIITIILIASVGEIWYWLMGLDPLSNGFLEIIYWFPINLLIGPIYLSFILGVSGGLLSFLVTLSFFVIGNVVLFYLVWNFEYQIFEDNYQLFTSQKIEPLSIEKSSEEMWWRKYLIPETPYSYPEIKKGTTAIFEKNILSSIRGIGDLISPYMIMVVSLIVTPLFSRIDLIYLFMIFVITVGLTDAAMNANMMELSCFYIDRTIPWDLERLAFYTGLSKLFFCVICYEGWVVYSLVIGVINSLSMLAVYALMGPAMFFMLLYANQFGFLWGSSPEDFSRDNFKIGGIWGSAMFFLLSILLILAVHSYVSALIDTAWKFVLIIPLVLGIGYMFIKLYDREWKFLTVKKRRTSLRKFGAASVCIILFIGFFGGFFYYIENRPPSYDFMIDEEMVMENKTFYFDDNIYIVEGGELTIRDSTLIFNTSEDDAFGIYLDRGGSLDVMNSTFRGGVEKYGVKVILRGEALVRDSIFKNVWGDEWDKNGEGGIELHSDDISFDNVTIDGGITNGIYIEDCSPEISNTTVNGCADDGIEIQEGAPVVKDTTITNNSWGVVIFNSEVTKFYDCKMSYNSKDGVYCEKSSVELYGCEISHNRGHGLELKKSEYLSEDTVIEQNYGGDLKEG
ncbi:MAG: right-handed parallel beta-helix repeat-containing protein [Thermoplasmatota archaeon]